jgi:hypothetical protein
MQLYWHNLDLGLSFFCILGTYFMQGCLTNAIERISLATTGLVSWSEEYKQAWGCRMHWITGGTIRKASNLLPSPPRKLFSPCIVHCSGHWLAYRIFL